MPSFFNVNTRAVHQLNDREQPLLQENTVFLKILGVSGSTDHRLRRCVMGRPQLFFSLDTKNLISGSYDLSDRTNSDLVKVESVFVKKPALSANNQTLRCRL